MKEIIDFINAIVRPLVTILLTGTLVWGFIVGLIGPGEFLALASVVIGFWFRDRQENSDMRADVKHEVTRAIEENK